MLLWLIYAAVVDLCRGHRAHSFVNRTFFESKVEFKVGINDVVRACVCTWLKTCEKCKYLRLGLTGNVIVLMSQCCVSHIAGDSVLCILYHC